MRTCLFILSGRMDSTIGDGGSLSPTFTARGPCRAEPGGHTWSLPLDGPQSSQLLPPALLLEEEGSGVRERAECDQATRLRFGCHERDR